MNAQANKLPFLLKPWAIYVFLQPKFNNNES